MRHLSQVRGVYRQGGTESERKRGINMRERVCKRLIEIERVGQTPIQRDRDEGRIYISV